MNRCAKCGRDIPMAHARWAGPYRLQKCQICGPFTQAEIAEVQQHVMKTRGVVHVSAPQRGYGGGCNCLGARN